MDSDKNYVAIVATVSILFVIGVMFFALFRTNSGEYLNQEVATVTSDAAESQNEISEQTASSEMTIEGEVVCLPQKDTGEPQSLECTYGLMTENGDYYKLLVTLFDGFKQKLSIDTGDRIRVTGTTTPPEASNVYDIEGAVEIETLEEI